MKPKANELVALFLAAGCSLLFQVTITKVFEYSVWANYAYLVISTAMFGLGFSGVLLTRFPKMLSMSETPFLVICCFGTALGMLGGFLGVNHIPIHLPDAPNGWPSELLNVGVVFLGLALPFVFFGLLISYLLEKRAKLANIYYFADLLGAGIGCFILVPLIPSWEPVGLVFFCIVGTAGAAFMFFPSKKGLLAGIVLLIVAIIIPPIARDNVPINVHVDKRYYTMDLENGRIEAHAYSALSRVDIAAFDKSRKRVWIAGGVNESNIKKFGLRQSETAPEILNTPHHVVRDIATIDPNDPWILDEARWDRLRNDFTNQYIQATRSVDVRIVPHLSKRDHLVCMIGTSGGDDSHAALRYGAHKVVGVEMDPQIAAFVSSIYTGYAGGLFSSDPKLNPTHSELAIDEGRSFLRRDTRKFDVIQQVNNFTPIAFQNGALNLSETYLLTVESFKDFWDSLSDDGILSISRWGTYRLETTAIEMLRREGMTPEQYSQHIVIIKGDNWLKHTLMLKRSPWTPEEVQKIQQFYADVKSDKTILGDQKLPHNVTGILYAPHIPVENLPAFKDGRSQNPYYLVATQPDPSKYYRFGPFEFSPPTDNKPFFNHFKTLGLHDPGHYVNQDETKFAGGSNPIVGREDIGIYEGETLIASLPAEVAQIEPPNLVGGRIAKGDLPPIIILSEALLLASIFFGLPLLSRREIREQLRGNKMSLGFFACLGVGFIFVEIVLIQQLVKFLGHPVYSISVTIGSLLVTAGLGSLFAARFQPKISTIKGIMWVAAIAIIILGFLLPLVTEIDALIQTSQAIKMVVAVLLVGCVGFILGMPMPSGIRFLKEEGRNVIPWAWAINGYFTVVGSALSVLLALFFGFKMMFLFAAIIYALAPFFLRKRA